MTRNHKRKVLSSAISVIIAGIFWAVFAFGIVQHIQIPLLIDRITPATDSGYDVSGWTDAFSKTAVQTTMATAILALLFCVGGLAFNFTHWPRTSYHRIVWALIAVATMIIAVIFTLRLPKLETACYWVWAFQILLNSVTLYWVTTALGAAPSFKYAPPLAHTTSKIRFWETNLNKR